MGNIIFSIAIFLSSIIVLVGKLEWPSDGFVFQIKFKFSCPLCREEEISALSADLENRTKVEPRCSFVHRVKEITKNSRKQDIDIEKILKDTRDLQLESNSIQERFNRTYAVVSETIFRYYNNSVHTYFGQFVQN